MANELGERDTSGRIWWRCPHCQLQFREEQLFRCVHCGIDYCISCSRGVNLYEHLTGRKYGEGWLCVPCCEELGPENYRLVAPSLYAHGHSEQGEA